MTSLWRKRKTSDIVAPNVQHNEHNEQKHDNLSDPLDLLHQENVRLKLWVDPPEGWKYGFPAIYDPNTDGQLSEWIISKGYPVQIIKEYGDAWAVRCWPAEEPH